MAGRGNVRSAAQVDELALAVERHDVLGDAADDLDLVVLAHAREEPDGLLARQLLAADREVLRHDRTHRLLDALRDRRG